MEKILFDPKSRQKYVRYLKNDTSEKELQKMIGPPILNLSRSILSFLNEDEQQKPFLEWYYNGFWTFFRFLRIQYGNNDSIINGDVIELVGDASPPPSGKLEKIFKRLLGAASIIILLPTLGCHSGIELGVLLFVMSKRIGEEENRRKLQQLRKIPGLEKNQLIRTATLMVNEWDQVSSRLLIYNSVDLCIKFGIFMGFISMVRQRGEFLPMPILLTISCGIALPLKRRFYTVFRESNQKQTEHLKFTANSCFKQLQHLYS